MGDMNLPNLPSGIYRHYKGPLYQVLGYAHDANFPARTAVLYIGLELDAAHTGARWAVRTATREQRQGADCFFDVVCGEPDCIHYGWTIYHNTPVCDAAHAVQRFTYLGPVLTEEMM